MSFLFSGLNPGVYSQLYLARLKKDNPYMVCRPKKDGKTFNPNRNDCIEFYENSKVGVTTVAQMLPKVKFTYF